MGDGSKPFCGNNPFRTKSLIGYAGLAGASNDGNNVQWNLKHLLPFNRDWVTTLA